MDRQTARYYRLDISWPAEVCPALARSNAFLPVPAGQKMLAISGRPFNAIPGMLGGKSHIYMKVQKANAAPQHGSQWALLLLSIFFTVDQQCTFNAHCLLKSNLEHFRVIASGSKIQNAVGCQAPSSTNWLRAVWSTVFKCSCKILSSLFCGQVAYSASLMIVRASKL